MTGKQSRRSKSRGKSTRKPIVRSWRVNRIRLLGPLEVFVIDESDHHESDAETNPCGCSCTQGGVCAGCGHSGCPERLLDLDQLDRFHSKAQALLIALVTNLGREIPKEELWAAIDPQPMYGSPIQSQMSAVRRTGLKVKSRRGEGGVKYEVADLHPRQVDALVFEEAHKDIQKLTLAFDEGTNKRERRDTLVKLSREALRLWRADPVASHPFVVNKRMLTSLRRRYFSIMNTYVRMLLRQPFLAAPDIAEARQAIEDIQELIEECEQREKSPPHFPELKELIELISQAEVSESIEQPAWLNDYRSYLESFEVLADVRPPGPGGLDAAIGPLVYAPLHVRTRTRQLTPEEQEGASRPPLKDAVEADRCVLVVGESGSGKSTFLRHECRRLLENDSSATPFLLEFVEFSHLTEDDLDREKLPWDALAKAFVDQLSRSGITATVDDVDRISRAGKAIWLLDGLNEIALPEIRGAVARVISNCAEVRWKNSRFVVTTTEEALGPIGLTTAFKRIDVDHLAPQDLERLFEELAATFYTELDEDARREKWEPLLTEVLRSPDLRELARILLHATKMADLFFKEERLPESRADLLKAAVSWWISKRTHTLRPYIRKARDVERAFSEIAFRMAADDKGPVSTLGLGRAAEYLAELPTFDGDVDRAKAFLIAAQTAGGLLLIRGPGDLGMHDAFRDYLAASWIAAKTDDASSGWWSEVEPRLDDPDWRRILTLVPGCLYALGSDRVDLFMNRLGQSCSRASLEVRGTRLALGGGVLRELSLAGFHLGEVPGWHKAVAGIRQLFDDPKNLSLPVRYDAAVAYGFSGDDRLADFDVTWAWLDEDEFCTGSQSEDPTGKNYDPDAAPWEGPPKLVEVRAFAIRKFPITVEEYRRFVEEDGYTDHGKKYWSTEGLGWLSSLRVEAPLEWEEQLLVPNAPVSGVSWFECEAFCNWLTKTIGDGATCRLPSEIEWEYAARRGTHGGQQFPWGNGMQLGDDAEANWAGCFLRRKSPVGLFPRSTTVDGVADLFGNVEEFCADIWPEDGSESRRVSQTESRRVSQKTIQRSAGGWSGEGIKRVVRGGSCIRFSRLCRPTYRSRILQDRRYLTVGFRPAKSL